MIEGMNYLSSTAELIKPSPRGRAGACLKPLNKSDNGEPVLSADDEDTIKTVSINGFSKGFVRKIGPKMYLWSNRDDEGRCATEGEAFAILGFKITSVDGNLAV